jgi:hypothetical protein
MKLHHLLTLWALVGIAAGMLLPAIAGGTPKPPPIREYQLTPRDKALQERAYEVWQRAHRTPTAWQRAILVRRRWLVMHECSANEVTNRPALRR